MNNAIFIPLEYQELDEEEMLARSSEFLERMEQRRSVRQFSSRSVPWEIIENCF